MKTAKTPASRPARPAGGLAGRSRGFLPPDAGRLPQFVLAAEFLAPAGQAGARIWGAAPGVEPGAVEPPEKKAGRPRRTGQRAL